MNREEAIAIIRKEYLCVDRDCDIERNCGKCDLMMPSKEPILEAYSMAIKALDQDPCDNCKYLDGDGCRLVFEQAEYGEASDECPNDNNELPSVNPQPCQEKWIDEDDNRYICKECEYAHKPQKEPCEDAISRDDALMCLTGEIKSTDTIETIIARFARRIRELPPVNPTKTGHWEQYGNSWEDKFKCSECGKEQPKILCGERISGHWSDYCPNCGCRMIEPQESEDKE